jgi:hypothetical protein
MEIPERLEIRPKNARSKGFKAVVWIMMIIIGIFSFPIGGFIFVLPSIMFLTVVQNKIIEYPITFVLTQNKLSYMHGRKEEWSIPWEDINSVYLITLHWSALKNIGIKLNKVENFQKSARSSSNNFISKIFTNTTIMRISRIISKYDIVIPYQKIDRSAIEFAELINSYKQYVAYR